jgi:hypothetical protein
MHDFEAGNEIVDDYKQNLSKPGPAKSQVVSHLNFNTRESYRDNKSGQRMGTLNVSAYDSPEIGRRGARLVAAN